MTKHLFAAALIAAFLTPTVSTAQGNSGNGNGNGNGQFATDCPPGLARKDPPCVPPGLARQGVDFADRYDIGDVLDPEILQYINNLDRYDLPPLADGERYAIIDGTIVRLDADSYELLQLIRFGAAILN